MNNELIAAASEKLELHNVVLHETTLVREDDKDPLSYPIDLGQQGMLSVNYQEITYGSEDDVHDVFRAFVILGLRAVKELEDNDEDVDIYFSLEAVYRVDYLLKEKLSDEEAEEFAQFNSVHNVWPFWRQHVFETLRSAELPRLNVPLMRGMVGKKKKK